MKPMKIQSVDYMKIYETEYNIKVKYYLMKFNKIPHSSTVNNLKINTSEFKRKITERFGFKIEQILDYQSLQSDTIFSDEKRSDYIFSNELIISMIDDPRKITIYYSENSENEKDEILKIISETLYVKPIEICFHMIVSSDDLFLRKMPIDEKSQYDMNLLYNDDLFNDLNKIDSFIKTDSTGLMLFHGIPGSGKTNFIKELIRRHPDQSFIYIPNKLFSAIDSINFVNFFIENKNSILIIEDAEALLIDREKGNFSISTLLNLTEGLLGEALKIRVICTFNCEISKIDKALTRKGRLKYIYEFKALNQVKANALFNILEFDFITDKDMPISDIFNFTHDNGFVKKEKASIGFLK